MLLRCLLLCYYAVCYYAITLSAIMLLRCLLFRHHAACYYLFEDGELEHGAPVVASGLSDVELHIHLLIRQHLHRTLAAGA